jgi:hypothetical protein
VFPHVREVARVILVPVVQRPPATGTFTTVFLTSPGASIAI